MERVRAGHVRVTKERRAGLPVTSIDWRAGGAHCCGTAAQTLSECFISPTDGTCAHMCAARCRRCRSGSGAPGSTDKVKNVQKQVDDVVAVMQSNLEKTLERGERLDQLQTKTGRWGVKGANWVAWANGQKTWSLGARSCPAVPTVVAGFPVPRSFVCVSLRPSHAVFFTRLCSVWQTSSKQMRPSSRRAPPSSGKQCGGRT